MDLALLVQQQGEMLDNIELNVNDAKNYVGKAEVNLKKAKEYHLAAKKVGFILKYINYLTQFKYKFSKRKCA